MKSSPIARYRPRMLLKRMAFNLGMDVRELVSAARLPRHVAKEPNPSVTAAQYFQLWETVDALMPGGISVEQACDYARGSFNAQAFAFSCSLDVATGLERLALFKPISGPYVLKIEAADTLRVEIGSADPSAPIPVSLYATEIVHLLEMIRMCSEHYVRPIAVFMPEITDRAEALRIYAGASVETGPLGLEISAIDAARPILSAGPEQWTTFGSGPFRQLSAVSRDASVVEKLRAALFELLPAGRANAEDAAERLFTSKRSLQRKLKAEGVSFGSVLEDTRRELALHYLTKEDLRIEEITHLLAFRDANSFYRAFQGWTGMTPRAARLANR